jgi:hypothetical protein
MHGEVPPSLVIFRTVYHQREVACLIYFLYRSKCVAITLARAVKSGDFVDELPAPRKKREDCRDDRTVSHIDEFLPICGLRLDGHALSDPKLLVSTRHFGRINS